MKLKDKGFSTKSVHSGEKQDRETGAISTPIYETSVFGFSSTKQLIDVMSNRTEGYVYTRFDNPTLRAVEKKMAKLENGEDATVFSSGMAAITSTVMTLASSGDHVVSTRDLYGGTLKLFADILPRFGIDVSLVEAMESNEIELAIRGNTKIIYAETLTNPTLKYLDMSKVAKLGRESGVTVVVDNTFASPYNLRPIQFGADVVIHSATKYLGGHNDLTAGVVVGSEGFTKKLKETRKHLGGTLDPIAAWLLLRGLKTLGLRMERHNHSGMQVAKYLERHPKVKRVYYPGLSSHPDHSIAIQQMKGFGGVVSFEIDGDIEKTMKFVESLELCLLAPSLGGTETLATQPVTSSHYFVDEESRRRAGITNQLVRLALGVEDPQDIISDLEQAFGKI